MERALVALNRSTRPATIVEDGARFFLRYEPPIAVGKGLIREDFMVIDELSPELFDWIQHNSDPFAHFLTIFTGDAHAAIARCAELGYAHGTTEHFMRLDLPASVDRAPTHAVVRVRPDDDVDRLRACGGPPVQRAQLEADGVHQYAVAVGGEFASRGMLLAEPGGVAFVTAMHTAPAHRRRGMASSILRRMIEDAESLGVHTLALKSTLEAAPLYASHGFESACMVVSLSREEPEAPAERAPTVSIEPGDRLRVPHSRRLVHEERVQEDGRMSLLLFYSNKEVSFDEPEFFPFGRGLLRHDTFVAESSCAWSDGAPHPWERVQPLLETLVREGILELVEDETEPPGSGRIVVERSSTGAVGVEPIEPDPTLCWSRAHDRCAELGERATGIAFELNQLESFIRIYRIAHPALDTEGRQVGEASVRNGLLQPIRTEWRLCKYPGSRFQAGPMNMTALRSLQKHWQTTSAWAAILREEFVRRYRLGPEPMSLAEVFLFSCSVLAMPAYQLMRPTNPLRGGEIDAALAALFRVIDGVRFPAEYLMLGVVEWPAERDASERVTTSQFLHFVEKTNLFEGGEGGMCSGPPRMVEEFVEFVLTGRGASPAGAQLEAQRERLIRSIGDLDAAFAYAAEALLLYCHRRWFDLQESALTLALRKRLRAEGAGFPAVVEPLDGWLAENVRRVQPDSNARSSGALREFVANLRRVLPDGLELPERAVIPARDRERGVRWLRARVTSALPAGVIDALLDALVALVSVELEHMHAVDRIQERINRLLARVPTRAAPFRRRELEASPRRTLATSVTPAARAITLGEALDGLAAACDSCRSA